MIAFQPTVQIAHSPPPRESIDQGRTEGKACGVETWPKRNLRRCFHARVANAECLGRGNCSGQSQNSLSGKPKRR